MTTNEDTIIKFYTAFSNGNAAQMCECYHANIKFRDPVFGLLKGNDVCKMWKMLLEKSKGNQKTKRCCFTDKQYQAASVQRDCHLYIICSRFHSHPKI